MRSGLLLVQAKPHYRPVLGFPKAFMGIIETQLKHVGYELDMLVYTFDKLLLVEPLVTRSFQAGQVNALIEAFCIHARNLDEFFQCSGQGNTLKAATFADSRYKPRPNDKERKNLLSKISRQILRLTEQRTSVADEKITLRPSSGVLSRQHFSSVLRPQANPIRPIRDNMKVLLS